MKLFLDTANLEKITTWSSTGLIDGVTTNPTHLSKEGGNIKALVLNICAAVGPQADVSVEVTAQKPDEVYEQAHRIAGMAKNIVVKIPCHRDYYAVIKRLVADGVPLNITLVFSLTQALLMCKLGVKYISPFVGRLDDIDDDGITLLQDIRQMLDTYHYPHTQLLAASLRDVRHVHAAILAGADVATMPVEVLEKMSTHPLTDKGMELFAHDWEKVKTPIDW